MATRKRKIYETIDERKNKKENIDLESYIQDLPKDLQTSLLSFVSSTASCIRETNGGSIKCLNHQSKENKCHRYCEDKCPNWLQELFEIKTLGFPLSTGFINSTFIDVPINDIKFSKWSYTTYKSNPTITYLNKSYVSEREHLGNSQKYCDDAFQIQIELIFELNVVPKVSLSFIQQDEQTLLLQTLQTKYKSSIINWDVNYDDKRLILSRIFTLENYYVTIKSLNDYIDN